MMIRRQLIVMPGLAVFLLGLITQAAGSSPAPTLPDDLIRATAISEAQRTRITEFVGYWVDSMLPGEGDEPEPRDVIEARSRLTGPLGRNPLPAFRTAYEQTLANGLAGVFDRPEVLLRINAALAMGPMRTEAILIPARRAIADDSPAVRYWAARSLRLFLESDLQQARFWLSNIPEPVQIAILDMLEPLLATEPSPDVMREMSAAVVVLGLDRADRVLLERLNERIRLFAENPSIRPTGIADTLAQISRNRLRLPGGLPADQVRREAVLVNYRYLLLVRDILQRHQAQELELDSRTLEQWRNLAGQCQTLLREWTSPPDADTPAEFTPGQINVETLTSRINAWRTVLSRAPYNLRPQDLQPNLR